MNQKIKFQNFAFLINQKDYQVNSNTLIESLSQRMEQYNDFLIFMDNKNNPTELSINTIYNKSEAVAQYFLSKGLNKNDKIIIMLPTCIEFVYIYFGILMAGGIPVPVSQPAGTSNIEKYLGNLKHIILNSDAKFFISHNKMLKITASLMNSSNLMSEFIFTSDIFTNEVSKENYVQLPQINEDDIALIQYTSGTTGKPKGVQLSHKNLIHNIHGISEALKMTPEDIGISWLPLYHDMGLIGGFLTCLYANMKLVLMPPEAYLFQPLWWLQNISKYGVTLGVAPNFGYHYCVTRIPDESIENLDLSTWRIALNGAEPIDRITLKKFINKFSKCGLREDIFLPVYGMAENSLAATFPSLDETTVIRRLNREKLEIDRIAVDLDSENSKEYIDIVSVGKPLLGQEVRIADDEGNTLDEREVGNILVKSPSLTIGYYKNDDATSKAVRDGWLYTGDLGFILDGLLYISGRKKEIIIKRGKNIYPYDVERIAATVKGVRLGACAAFAVFNEQMGTEDLVLVCETLLKGKEKIDELSKRISNEILAKLGFRPDDIKLVKKGTIPKTTSGKIQRILCKKIYLEGNLVTNKSRNMMVLVRTVVLSYFNMLNLKVRG